jgi:hypothetical protein
VGSWQKVNTVTKALSIVGQTLANCYCLPLPAQWRGGRRHRSNGFNTLKRLFNMGCDRELISPTRSIACQGNPRPQAQPAICRRRNVRRAGGLLSLAPLGGVREQMSSQHCRRRLTATAKCP